jgi:hypothetical protein
MGKAQALINIANTRSNTTIDVLLLMGFPPCDKDE